MAVYTYSKKVLRSSGILQCDSGIGWSSFTWNSAQMILIQDIKRSKCGFLSKFLSQKVHEFVFTWGSASYCFHLQAPVRTHVQSAKGTLFLQGRHIQSLQVGKACVFGSIWPNEPNDTVWTPKSRSNNYEGCSRPFREDSCYSKPTISREVTFCTKRQASASCPAVLQLSWKALDSNRNQDHVPWLDPWGRYGL